MTPGRSLTLNALIALHNEYQCIPHTHITFSVCSTLRRRGLSMLCYEHAHIMYTYTPFMCSYMSCMYSCHVIRWTILPPRSFSYTRVTGIKWNHMWCAYKCAWLYNTDLIFAVSVKKWMTETSASTTIFQWIYFAFVMMLYVTFSWMVNHCFVCLLVQSDRQTASWRARCSSLADPSCRRGRRNTWSSTPTASSSTTRTGTGISREARALRWVYVPWMSTCMWL